MLKIFGGKKALLITIAMMVLGWAGVNTDLFSVSSLLGMVEEAQQENQTKYPNMHEDKETPLTPEQYTGNTTTEFNKASAISPQRRVHILYGDKTGGGHRHGTGKPASLSFLPIGAMTLLSRPSSILPQMTTLIGKNSEMVIM